MKKAIIHAGPRLGPGFSRYRQIAGDKGAGFALKYLFGILGDFILNAAAESVSRTKGSISGLFSESSVTRDKLMTYSDYRTLKRKDPYYRGRWLYLSKVIDMVRELSPGSILELGPRRMPIAKNADTMDNYFHGHHLTYLHDATCFPWPIEDKKYDLFIALQVWEHLDGAQREAFREVMRVSGAALLSFPYKRYRPGDPHHGIDEKTVKDWTLNVEPEKAFRAGPVMVAYYRF